MDTMNSKISVLPSIAVSQVSINTGEDDEMVDFRVSRPSR